MLYQRVSKVICEQHTSHVTFSRTCMRTFQCHIDIGSKFGVRSAHFTSSHASSSCAHVVCLILRDSPFLFHFPSYRLFHLPGLSPSSSTMWRTNSLCTLAKEDIGTLAEYDSLTSYEPNDYHISETTELYIQESSGERGSLNSHDLEYDDYTIGMALSSPLFTQEREDAASRRRAYHSPDEGLSSSQSSSVGHRTGRPVAEQFDSQISNVRENPRCSSEMSKSEILLERQREHILADCQAEIQKHEFQADYDRRSVQTLNEVIESQRG